MIFNRTAKRGYSMKHDEHSRIVRQTRDNRYCTTLRVKLLRKQHFLRTWIFNIFHVYSILRTQVVSRQKQVQFSGTKNMANWEVSREELSTSNAGTE